MKSLKLFPCAKCGEIPHSRQNNATIGLPLQFCRYQLACSCGVGSVGSFPDDARMMGRWNKKQRLAKDPLTEPAK